MSNGELINATDVEFAEFIRPRDIKMIKRDVYSIEGQNYSIDYIRGIISGNLGGVEDDEYFKFFQSSLILNNRLQIGNRYNGLADLPELAYRGVDKRIKDNPNFENRFVDFLTGLYRFCIEQNIKSVSEQLERCVSSNRTEAMRKIRSGYSHDVITGRTWLKAFDSVMSIRDEEDTRVIFNRMASLPQEVNERLTIGDYVLYPGIQYKDTSKLLSIAQSIENGNAHEILELGNDKERITFMASDFLYRILKEASFRGWENARGILTDLRREQQRDIPVHSAWIRVGNHMSDMINRAAILPEELEPIKIDPLTTSGIDQAIDRIMYTSFSLGSKKPNEDPTNYIVSAQIATKLFKSADSLEEITDTSPSRSKIPTPIGRNSKHEFFNRWKAGYGILS